MEQTILACDVCGAPAATTVTVKVDGKSLQKDLCSEHVAELVNGARPARPGRRRSPGPIPTRRRRKTTAGVARTSKKSTARVKSRRTRRSQRSAQPTGATNSPSTE
jgi:hypothetical protein